VILALDLGSVTGVCVGTAGGSALCGSWRMAPGAGAEVGEFFASFQGYLLGALVTHRPSLIAFEAPWLGPHLATNMHTARRLLGMPAIVEMHAHMQKIDCVEVPPASARKVFTGSGKANKTEVQHWAARRGFGAANHHEADACAVWFFAATAHDPHAALQRDPLFAGGADA